MDKKKSVAVLLYNAEEPSEVMECITRLDNHQIWHDVEIHILCNTTKEEGMKRVLFNPPTVWPISISHSSLNESISQLRTDYVLLIDSHVNLDTDDWIQALAGYAQRDDVGAVGGKIWNPNADMFHAGGYLMVDGTVQIVLPEAKRGSHGYEAMLWHPRNTTFVSGRFLFIRTDHLKEMKGISEDMEVSWAEDLCIRLCLQGKRNVILPYVECTNTKKVNPVSVSTAFQNKYKNVYSTDPYLNPNLIQYFYERG